MAFDGLRGVAAVLVLFHHTVLMLPDFATFEWYGSSAVHGWGEWLLIRTPLRLMWEGQERALLFFVLSGFVLATPWLEGQSVSYGSFLLSRFCRIYPPYLIAMGFAACGSVLLGGHPLSSGSIYFNQLGWAFQPSWGAIPSIMALLNNTSSQYMNEAVWSLVWEIRVALIFPLLIIPMKRWGNFGIIGTLGALFVLQYIATLLINRDLSDTLGAPQATFYYAQFFVLGVAACTVPLLAIRPNAA